MVMTLNNEMFFFSGQSQLIDFLTQKIHECFLVLGKKMLFIQCHAIINMSNLMAPVLNFIFS